MNNDKHSLRLWVKKEREKLDIKQISKCAVEKIRDTAEYKFAKNIMIFYPLKNEIDFLDLLNDKDKNFYLPKINNNSLLCCPYKKDDMLCKSCFNTQEPITESQDKTLLDLIIVPALACDKNNYRLGYGGGFYDRFLKEINAKTVCCIPQSCLINTIYPNEFDVKVDCIVCV